MNSGKLNVNVYYGYNECLVKCFVKLNYIIFLSVRIYHILHVRHLDLWCIRLTHLFLGNINVDSNAWLSFAFVIAMNVKLFPVVLFVVCTQCLINPPPLLNSHSNPDVAL